MQVGDHRPCLAGKYDVSLPPLGEATLLLPWQSNDHGWRQQGSGVNGTKVQLAVAAAVGRCCCTLT